MKELYNKNWNMKWIQNPVVLVIFFFLTLSSCMKEEIVPNVSSDDNTALKVSNGSIVINLGVPGEKAMPVLNEYNQKIGSVVLNSNGKELYVMFQPNREWILKESYMHLAAKDEFPLMKGTKVPDLSRFDYKYTLTNTEWDMVKVDVPPYYNEEIEEIVPYGRPKPLFKVDLKKMDIRGIMAFNVDCRKIGEIQVLRNEGIAWMEGIRFEGRSPAMYINYVIFSKE